MNLETWIAFIVAAEIILIIPGPTILLVVSQAVVHGRKSVVPLVLGVLLGDFTAMVLSLLGLGAVLSTSAALFPLLKWIGVLYLFYLGGKLWRTPPVGGVAAITTTNVSNAALCRSAFIVTALNPKSIAFFVAFLPQFVTPQSPAVPQLVTLGVTFLVFATVNAALYAVFAGHLRDTMQKRAVRKWFNRCGGGALIGAGLFTAAMRQSS